MKPNLKLHGMHRRQGEILVIDDNLQNLKLLEEVLIEAGYKVRLTKDSELALRSAIMQPPSLILLDIRMPGMDGFELCRRLKAEEKTSGIPIIFISILEDKSDKVKAFQAGGVDYITKPFQPEEVLARIQTHLRLQELTERLEEIIAERTAALQESEAKYRLIVETASEGIWMMGSDLLTSFVNARMAKLLGCTPEEMIGRPVTEFLFEDDVPGFHRRMEQRRTSSQPETFEGRYRRKDGSTLWAIVSATPLIDDEHRFIGSFGMFTDISERKAAEEMVDTRIRMLEATYKAGLSRVETLRRMLDEIEAATGSSIGFFHFLEEDQVTISLQGWSTNTVTTMCSAEGTGSHYPLDKAGVWADCVREGRPVIHNDYASLPNRRGMPEGHARVLRELVVPIRRGNKIVAIVGVGNKPEAYTGTDVQNVTALGDFSWEIVIRKLAEERLEKLNQELEQRVQERTAELEEKNEELERANRLFVGRELKMMELKKQIEKLEKQIQGTCPHP